MAALIRQIDQLRRRRFALMRSGARMLLDRLEWEVETVLHLGRGLFWVGTFVLLLFGAGASIGGMLAASFSVGLSRLTGHPFDWRIAPGSSLDWATGVGAFVFGGAAWLAYWLILRRSGAWRTLRYPIIVLDVVSILRFAVATWAAGITGAAVGISPQTLTAVIPAALVLIMLTGILRLSPVTGAVAGGAAIVGQIVTGALLQIPTSVQSALLTLFAITLALGMQFVFVLRGLALQAAQEGVLERFVPQGLTQRLAHAGGTVPARVVPVTILIADIRGFTTLSEPLGPTEAVALLNSFFATIVGPLAAESAVLDKYLGDGMLAFVEGEDHAARGLRAAHRIVQAVQETNAQRSQPLRIGIGVHTAPAFVGSIGAPVRMEYTIIGDAVNVTSRLESVMSSKAGAERLDAVLVASSETVSQAAAAGYSIPELQGPVPLAVHGRAQSVDVYYLPPQALVAPPATARAAAGNA